MVGGGGLVLMNPTTAWGPLRAWIVQNRPSPCAPRKKFGVKYPAMYATGDTPAANQFNCTQRGHQNSLESLPSFLALLLVAGVRFPVTATIAGVVYNVGKVAYFNGYATGDPDKRLRGGFSYFGYFTLIGAVIRYGIELISM